MKVTRYLRKTSRRFREKLPRQRRLKAAFRIFWHVKKWLLLAELVVVIACGFLLSLVLAGILLAAALLADGYSIAHLYRSGSLERRPFGRY